MFKKAGLVKKKLKILVYGGSGVGKTHFALTFPGVAMIDLEGGSELFSDRFDFNVLRTKDPSEIMAAVDWISDNADQFETLVIDPITVLWQVLMEAGQVNAENRAKRKNSRANLDNVALTPRDWGIIKRKVNALYTRLVNMPCSVVVCGRVKDVNNRKGNEIIKVGEKVDAEKSTEYMFDIVIKMVVANGKRIGIVEKDRSGKLQGKKLVDPSFADFADILKAHSSGSKSQQQDASEVAKKAAEKMEPETKAANGKVKKAAHWIDGKTRNDKPVRAMFWAWAREDRGLSDAEVHEALEVEHIRDFAGDLGQAKTKIEAWIAKQAKVKEPTAEKVPF